MHTHFSAVHAVGFFFCIIILGTLWRLTASHLTASDRPLLEHIGKAMAFQY
jgi:hypothetical protein